MFLRFFVPAFVVLAFHVTAFGQQAPLRLWFDKPARQWEETLPLGNGRLGMTPDGGVAEEKIVLNDITLWSGAPQDANNYQAHKKLPDIRRLILEGRNDEAQALVNSDFVCTGKGSGAEPFGCFQTLGDLVLKFRYGNAAGGEVQPTAYTRQLSLQDAVATSTFQLHGVTYTREYFTSFGDDVAIVRLTASKPGQLSCTVGLNRAERSATTALDATTLQMTGQLDNGTDGKGMRYKALVKAVAKGGKQRTAGHDLSIEGASEITLFISAGTDFRDAAGFEWRVQQQLETAVKRPYAQQKKNHIAAYQKLYNRVTLALDGPQRTETTDVRLEKFLKDRTSDNGLPVLFFQFGRYLTICSTRVGLLPPNLQGLWAKEIRTPWNGDYHLDVNVQMNHWPVEVVNLSELNLPLAELVRGLVEPGQRTAQAYYQAEGWVAHVITNVWGFTEPGESASWGAANAGSGWLCNNLWQHYDFTGDRQYLQSIYPILKGSAQFYSSVLMQDPATGWLVTAPSVSPENTFYLPNGKHASICMGPTIDNQIVRELFTNVIAAAKTLNVDADFRRQLEEKLAKVPPAGRVSSDGRIMEWLQEYKETDLQHRHISHLYGLYPASLITPTATPALATAARKTLEVRGDDGPSWTIAYKLLFWARLQDGNRSYKLLSEILKPTVQTHINYGAGGGVYPNLLSAGPPFQIDGNFGATAGIAEMLIQSHDGFIDLLPALPDVWKPGGTVKGLKARGNYTVDIAWKDGLVTSYTISSPTGGTTRARVNGVLGEVPVKKR
ncbi:glycoside hydrolase N-terminal domain-containing protein [Fulvivirgaceae bacterium PWU37]|uniref:Glycoside hydrolase N-terminal domain-containing protein n=3 Tax=Dawidia TaxID=2963349 RepID=A0AAP2GKQ4_9BACT|nr:glycoside hydrolase N-terminal domain-containing protein [Dawidia soli]